MLVNLLNISNIILRLYNTGLKIRTLGNVHGIKLKKSHFLYSFKMRIEKNLFLLVFKTLQKMPFLGGFNPWTSLSLNIFRPMRLISRIYGIIDEFVVVRMI